VKRDARQLFPFSWPQLAINKTTINMEEKAKKKKERQDDQQVVVLLMDIG